MVDRGHILVAAIVPLSSRLVVRFFSSLSVALWFFGGRGRGGVRGKG